MNRRLEARILALVVVAVTANACAGATRSPSPPPSPTDAAPGSSLADHPLLGSWKSSISEQDLRAGGITDAGLIAENVGVSTKTYSADGTWVLAYVSPQPVRWPVFRGTWRVSGTGEIEETTTFPEDYAGEVIRYSWERDGAGIRFDVINPPDPVLPILTETHAWQPA